MDVNGEESDEEYAADSNDSASFGSRRPWRPPNDCPMPRDPSSQVGKYPNRPKLPVTVTPMVVEVVSHRSRLAYHYAPSVGGT
ncbi:hypothetical protein AHAS_Ahas13G0264800 [Arachis hypogaea]